MSRGARVLIAALVAIAASASASAQSPSLGQVAKQEEARRASAKKAARSFSNDDLGPGPIVSPAASTKPAEACYQSASTGECVTADEMIVASNAKMNAEVTQRKEAVWRGAAGHIRSLLAKLQDEAGVLAASAASENKTPAERRSAANLLTMKQRSIAEQERRWYKLVDDADREQIPREWYEPAPRLSTRTLQ